MKYDLAEIKQMVCDIEETTHLLRRTHIFPTSLDYVLKLLELKLLSEIAESLESLQKSKVTNVNNYSVSSGDRPEENFKDPDLERKSVE